MFGHVAAWGLRAVVAGVTALLGLSWLCRARRDLGVPVLCAVPAVLAGVGAAGPGSVRAAGLGGDRPVPAGVRPLCCVCPTAADPCLSL